MFCYLYRDAIFTASSCKCLLDKNFSPVTDDY